MRYSMPSSANAATSTRIELWLRDITSAFSFMGCRLKGALRRVKMPAVTALRLPGARSRILSYLARGELSAFLQFLKRPLSILGIRGLWRQLEIKAYVFGCRLVILLARENQSVQIFQLWQLARGIEAHSLGDARFRLLYISEIEVRSGTQKPIFRGFGMNLQ